MLNLNIRLGVGWKTLPNLKFSNLNFKLKFQTQTWTSKNYNLPCPHGNPGFWEFDSKGKMNEINEAMSWIPGKAMRCSRGGTEGFWSIDTHVLFTLCRIWRKSKPCEEEIRFLVSCYNLPCARNLKSRRRKIILLAPRN